MTAGLWGLMFVLDPGGGVQEPGNAIAAVKRDAVQAN